MSLLEQQFLQTLPPGITLPQEFVLLFDWIEANGFFIDDPIGLRAGFLYSQEKSESGWVEQLGTDITFVAEGNRRLGNWFSQTQQRLLPFAITGGDGSMAAFWLDPQGKQQIVHLGSGSGSTLACVLADDPVDFLRLIAIGYDEICWIRQSSSSLIQHWDIDDQEFSFPPNIYFRKWVENTFQVSIPSSAIEIIKYPAQLEDEASQDPFWQWLQRIR